MKIVSVCSVETGWEVRSDLLENGQLFVNGAGAERAARRLAKAIAHAGEDACLHVYLRGGALGGTRMVWAREPSSLSLGAGAGAGRGVEICVQQGGGDRDRLFSPLPRAGFPRPGTV